MDENEAYLKALDEVHNPASVEDDVFDDVFIELPDGVYQGRLDSLYFSRSKKKECNVFGSLKLYPAPRLPGR